MIITPSDYELLDESGKFYLVGKGTEAEVKNGNGRFYPEPILKNAFFELKRVLDSGRGKIYSNHEHPKNNPQPILTKDTIGHLVDMEWRNETKTGHVKIYLDPSLPKGEEIIRRYQAGEMLGVSHRARGTLDESTGGVKTMTLFTFDTTVIPSCKTCVLNLSESQEKIHLAEIEEYFEVENKDYLGKEYKRQLILNSFKKALRR